VNIQPVHVEGLCRSVLKVEAGDSEVHVVMKADTMEVRGVGSAAGGGSRWANAGILPAGSKLDFAVLLQRLLLNQD
jgi:hypothetical protein